MLLALAPGIVASHCQRVQALPPAPPALPVSGQTGLSEAPAGTVYGGIYHDGSYPFSVALIEGWVVRTAAASQSLRASFLHVSTGSALEVKVRHDVLAQPQPRQGCQWGFLDRGAYESLRLPGPVSVATCLPDEPGQSMVMGTYAVHEGLAYHFELVVPPGRLLEATTAADGLLRTVKFY